MSNLFGMHDWERYVLLFSFNKMKGFVSGLMLSEGNN